MRRAGWQSQLRQSQLGSHRRKTDLLPLPQPITDVLSLEYHLMLEMLRVGAGTLHSIKVLMRIAVAAELLAKDGYGKMSAEQFAGLYEAASQTLDKENVGRVCAFDHQTFDLFASLVTMHDIQLQSAPTYVIEKVGNALDKMTGGHDHKPEGRPRP